MRLHENKDAFLYVLNSVNERTGIRIDILEKDYYVTLILEELADKQKTTPAYFKGGTALYKALGSMKRFSEDIDITVEVGDCANNSQAKKRLENVSKKYTALSRTSNKDEEIDKKSSITSVYDYTPISSVDDEDPLQRFRRVKVEATSFTVSEPFETSVISPVIYQEATDQERSILENSFDVKPFNIQTIKIERIFTDKIFAAEFYYSKKEYDDAAKHIYDLAIMMSETRIKELLEDSDKFADMISLKRKEEFERIGSDLSDKMFCDFNVFCDLDNNDLALRYKRMQDIYVLNPADRVELKEVKQSLGTLREVLLRQDGIMQTENENKSFKTTMI